MKTKRCVHYFRPGDLAGLERELDRQSHLGWQAERPGRFVQRYRRGAGDFVHRIGYCAGDAEAEYLAENEAAGWHAGPRKRDWILFRKPASDALPDERLPRDRAPIKVLFERRIARLESVRRWMLVLAAGLLIGGYATALKPVLLGSVLPLAVMLFVSYRIKFMEEGLRK